MSSSRTLRISLVAVLALPAVAEISAQNPSTPSSPPAAANAGGPDFIRLLDVHGAQLDTMASNQEALAFFTSKLAPSLGLQEAVGFLKPGTRGTGQLPGSSPQSLETSAVRLTEALTRWHLAHMIRRSVAGEDGTGTVLSDRQKQIAWMTTVEPSPRLLRMMPLLEAYEWGQSIPPVEHPTYEGYRAAVDRAYPETVVGETAWLSVMETEGARVLRSRLITEPVGAPVPESVRAQMAAHYFGQRLRPLIEGRVEGLAADVERDAVIRAYAEWDTLRSVRDRMREIAGLKRLCGSWQWTIHNHRNHGEQKTTMVFGAPGTDQSGPAKPKETVVLGDAVYLRWELSGGIVQEDSLLLIGEGKRLEGSFVNSSGSWGSITGKRLQGCKTP